MEIIVSVFSGPSSFSNFAGLDDDMVAYQNDTAAGDAGVTPATDEAVDLPLGAVPDSWEDRYDDFDRERKSEFYLTFSSRRLFSFSHAR